MLERARARARTGGLGTEGIAVLIVAAVIILPPIAGFAFIASLLTREVVGGHHGIALVVEIAVGLVCLLSGGWMAMRAVYGLMISNLVSRALASEIDQTLCAGCQYSLAGLASMDGFVMCPECGSRQCAPNWNCRALPLTITNSPVS